MTIDDAHALFHDIVMRINGFSDRGASAKDMIVIVGADARNKLSFGSVGEKLKPVAGWHYEKPLGDDNWIGQICNVAIYFDPSCPAWTVQPFAGVDRSTPVKLLKEATPGSFTVSREDFYRHGKVEHMDARPEAPAITGFGGWIPHPDAPTLEESARFARMSVDEIVAWSKSHPGQDPDLDLLVLRKEIYDQAIAECSAHFDKTYGETIENQANEIERLKMEITLLRRPREPQVVIDMEWE